MRTRAGRGSRSSLCLLITTHTRGQTWSICPAWLAIPAQSKVRMPACLPHLPVSIATAISWRRMSACFRCMLRQMRIRPYTQVSLFAGCVLSPYLRMCIFTMRCIQPSMIASAATPRRERKRLCSCRIACSATAKSRCRQTALSAIIEAR